MAQRFSICRPRVSAQRILCRKWVQWYWPTAGQRSVDVPRKCRFLSVHATQSGIRQRFRIPAAANRVPHWTDPAPWPQHRLGPLFHLGNVWLMSRVMENLWQHAKISLFIFIVILRKWVYRRRILCWQFRSEHGSLVSQQVPRFSRQELLSGRNKRSLWAAEESLK